MISMKELLSGQANLEDLDQDIQDNLNELLRKSNLVRAKYNQSMIVSSGLRTMEHHLDIYRAKAKKEGKPFDESKVPKKSKHLYGQAADFVPKDVAHFKQWLIDNDDWCREIGIWFEEFDSTPNWVHIQIVPYGSFKEGGSLQFKP